jgi:predicted nuclease of restriction endonuclease-like (RecB) superfamily
LTTTDGQFPGYDDVLRGVVELLESARRAAARAVNAAMTATYWEIGRRIVEFEQGGQERAAYGEGLIRRLADDLTQRFGRGFSATNLKQFKKFYLVYRPVTKGQTPTDLSLSSDPPQIGQTPSDLSVGGAAGGISQTPSAQSPPPEILQTPSGKSSEATGAGILQTLSEQSDLTLPSLAKRFPLPWSHDVRLIKVQKPEARRFYEAEALRGGWTIRQLDRQVSTLFYERTLASRNKAAMLKKGQVPRPGESLTPEEEIKDPLVLEFLGLKDEYSENDLEEALVRDLEAFLLELGGDFTFVGRQRRLRVGDEWYRIDLLFFHRRLRCLVVIDLKVGKFTHVDAGQMLLYLGYAAEHWTQPGENPPVGLILCAQHNTAVAHYTLDRLSDKVLAAENRMALPDEQTLAAELERTQQAIERRRPTKRKGGQP